MQTSREQIWFWPTRIQILRLVCSATGTILVLWLAAGVVPVFAQQRQQSKPDEPYTNPLDITKPDPLLPQWPLKKPLTPPQIQALTVALDELNKQASAQLQAGNVAEAFKIWYRELRLRRFLGPLAEVEALTRVADIALSQNQTTQVQLITQRLQVIYLEAQDRPPVDPQLLQALGNAFVLVQARQSALDVYQQILANARSRQDRLAQETALKTIAELNFGGLNFSEAAVAYEELLALSEAKVNRTPQMRLEEDIYLQQLAFIYNHSKQHQKALDIRTKILNRYRELKDPTQVATLKIAMGGDYEALGQLGQAAQYYQEAYTLAWSLQQFARAGEALQKLGALYRSQNELEAALQVYQVLVVVDQKGYNFFGMMNTYDQIGKIYLDRKAYTQALAAFQKGLELAKQLKYQEDYFTRQIAEVNQQRSE